MYWRLGSHPESGNHQPRLTVYFECYIEFKAIYTNFVTLSHVSSPPGRTPVYIECDN